MVSLCYTRATSRALVLAPLCTLLHTRLCAIAAERDQRTQLHTLGTPIVRRLLRIITHARGRRAQDPGCWVHWIRQSRC